MKKVFTTFHFQRKPNLLYLFIGLLFCFYSPFIQATIELSDPSLSPQCTHPEPSVENLRSYARGVANAVDITDNILTIALDHPFEGTGSTYMQAFSYLYHADEIACAFYRGDISQALKKASQYATSLAFGKLISGTVFATPFAFANLAATIVTLPLEAFADTAVQMAINNQYVLYSAARRLGYSQLFLLKGISDDTIFFTDDGWLYIVGDKQIPSYGAVRPGQYRRLDVYGALEAAYTTSRSIDGYLPDKKQMVDEFQKMMLPSISNLPVAPSAPVEVTFEPTGLALTSSSIVSYTWEFGDGSTAMGKTSSHVYRIPKNYQVKLTTQDSTGFSHIYTESIIIRPPEINVSYPSGYESLKRDFSTTFSPYVTKYSWDFGDQTPQVEGRTPPTHTYATSNSYTVTLNFTLDDGSNISNQNSIFAGPGTRYISGHTITGHETWFSGGTYVITGTVTVAYGGTLTIEPGTTVRGMPNAYIRANGTLSAAGVTFTWVDEQQGEWRGIAFADPGANASRLDHCTVEHAKGLNILGVGSLAAVEVYNASPSIVGSTVQASSAPTGIMINNVSNPVVQDSTVSGFSGQGIQVDMGYTPNGLSAPVITGNTLTGNGYGIVTRSKGVYRNNVLRGNQYGTKATYSGNANPVIEQNTYANNNVADLEADGSLTSAVHWDDAGSLRLWGLTVETSGSLSLPTGVTARIYPGSLIRVNGTLTAAGVTFTWVDEQQGEWRGIAFADPGANASRLDHCTVEHAKGLNILGVGSLAAVEVYNASPSIVGSTVQASSAPTGIMINNVSNPVVQDSTVSGFSGQGIQVDMGYTPNGLSAPVITGNTLTGNGYGIATRGMGTISNNLISKNTNYGLYNYGSNVLNATQNNWGDPSGPLDDSDDKAKGGLYNPKGLGDKVSDKVNYKPWIGMHVNQVPIANAGTDQTVANGSLVTLSGGNSSDPDNAPLPLKFTWSQISGPVIIFNNAATANPSFSPPQSGDYVFGLVVNDGELDSLQSTVIVHVSKTNQTITFGLAPKVMVDRTGAVTATGGGSNNPIIFSSQTTGVCTVNGATVSGVTAGTCTIAANQAGNANYNAAPQVTLSFDISAGFALTLNNLNPLGGTITSDTGGLACGVACSTTIISGGAVKLVAIPVAGYQFSGWGGDCWGYGNSCTLTMNTVKSVTAKFEVLNNKRRKTWKLLF